MSESNFKKCKVQVIQVHIGTYWYVLVRTCIDINHKHASMESHSSGIVNRDRDSGTLAAA